MGLVERKCGSGIGRLLLVVYNWLSTATRLLAPSSSSSSSLQAGESLAELESASQPASLIFSLPEISKCVACGNDRLYLVTRHSVKIKRPQIAGRVVVGKRFLGSFLPLLFFACRDLIFATRFLRGLACRVNDSISRCALHEVSFAVYGHSSAGDYLLLCSAYVGTCIPKWLEMEVWME